jgi:hypothetical protein
MVAAALRRPSGTTLELKIITEPPPAPGTQRPAPASTLELAIASEPPPREKKRSRWLLAAPLLLVAALAGAYQAGLFSSAEAVNAAAKLPAPAVASAVVVPATSVNEAKLALASELATQGKWDEAAVAAEEGGRADLARTYRTEDEAEKNLRACQSARAEERLNEALAACYLAEQSSHTLAARVAVEVGAELRKPYKAEHIPLTKKHLKRNTPKSLVEARHEIELLARYFGPEDKDAKALRRELEKLTKKLKPNEALALTGDAPDASPLAAAKPDLTKTPAPAKVADPKGADATPTASPSPATETPTPAGKVYALGGAYLKLGAFSNSAKKADPSLGTTYQSAISRQVSKGKLSAPPAGKIPITVSGAVTKAETKKSGSGATVSVHLSLQVTRENVLLASFSKNASSEYDSMPSSSEEKEARAELVKMLSDLLWNDLQKSLPKFK